MKEMVIPIVIGDLDTDSKGFVQSLEDMEIRWQVEIIQSTELMKSAWILRRVLRTCCHSNSSDKPSASGFVKNSQKWK